jgi:hypothetical protein
MSKSLSSIKFEVADTIKRRIMSGTMGLGYWAAVDALAYSTSGEAEQLCEKAKAAKQAAGVPGNWIARV